MRTVKEVSEITGISVRTLHYYDEIGLLKPTKVNEVGYRLYDDKAMERLQQILFFREFDMPLKEIKSILENPAFDRNQILQSQRRMLILKKEHLENLISSIDSIIGGNNNMDFKVFNKDDIESIFQAQMTNMPDEQRKTVIEQYGSEEEFHKHFEEQMSSEQAQKNLHKVMEWYGDKDSMMKSATQPIGLEAVQAYQKRLDKVLEKLADRRDLPVSSFEVKEVIGEYGFVMKQMLRIKDEKELMCETAQLYKTNCQMKEAFDAEYGEGMADYFAKAVLEFYK